MPENLTKDLNIGSGNGLGPYGNKPMLTQISVGRQEATNSQMAIIVGIDRQISLSLTERSSGNNPVDFLYEHASYAALT